MANNEDYIGTTFVNADWDAFNLVPAGKPIDELPAFDKAYIDQDSNLMKNEIGVLKVNNTINFPTSFPESERIKVCKLLDEKDAEISKLYKDIIVLENKIERFNGSLTWKEAENLKTQMAINNAIIEQVYAGLKKFNLRAKQFENSKSSNVLDVKLEKIPLFERIATFFKSLIKFQIVRKV